MCSSFLIGRQFSQPKTEPAPLILKKSFNAQNLGLALIKNVGGKPPSHIEFRPPLPGCSQLLASPSHKHKKILTFFDILQCKKNKLFLNENIRFLITGFWSTLRTKIKTKTKLTEKICALLFLPNVENCLPSLYYINS